MPSKTFVMVLKKLPDHFNPGVRHTGKTGMISNLYAILESLLHIKRSKQRAKKTYLVQYFEFKIFDNFAFNSNENVFCESIL